jgi:[amino group carrier protein]-lysine/ornithine hydrolase
MMSETHTLIQLVQQYSPSGDERGAVEWLVSRMAQLGYTEAFIDGAGNAVGKIGSGSKQVLLLGHIDTVPGEIPVRVEGDTLFGRGCVDAKGALACFVDAAASAGSMDGWQFTVIGAVDEERNSAGARFVVDQYAPDFAIIGEPNRWDRISLGYKGSALANIRIQRPQAHTASGGPTACEQAIETWLDIKRLVENYNQGRERLFEKLLVSLLGFESGSDEFVQWAGMRLAARLPLTLPPEQWYQRLVSSARGAHIEAIGFPVPAWQCQKNTPLVRALLGGIRSQGGTPSFVYKTGTADLNIVAPVWKCPAVVYGPGDSAYDHTPDEQISLEEYTLAVLALSSALAILKR